MNSSKLMKERIRRIEILLKELGFSVEPEDRGDEIYSASVFEDERYLFGVSVDKHCKFLELGFSFGFSHSLRERVRRSMEEVLATCYEFGLYITISPDENEFVLSVFSKIYFAGLNYYSLKETVRDLRSGITLIDELYDFSSQIQREESGGNT